MEKNGSVEGYEIMVADLKAKYDKLIRDLEYEKMKMRCEALEHVLFSILDKMMDKEDDE